MKQQQEIVLLKEEFKCWLRIQKYNNETPPGGQVRCPPVWDNILCWDAAPAGTRQELKCPEYIQNFNHDAYATRDCDENGEWYYNPELNSTWTNFLECVPNSDIKNHAEHAERLLLIQNIGYGISLCSLVIAVFIMCCSRLKSKSNTLHVNLFLAFILRAGFAFAQRLLFVDGLGLEKDVTRTVDGKLHFIEEGPHWECRLLFTIFMYSLSASHSWIFVEGLYLHMLIYRTLSTERNGVSIYIILGWTLPFISLVPWIIVKAVADNIFCWNISKNSSYIWVFHGPLLVSIAINFFFFLNISRVLCTRVRSGQRHVNRAKYRHLAKFILVLMPLFGVIYVILTALFPTTYTNRFDLTPMFVEQTYNAFQGFILALLFCFLNEEVHNEMKRIWWRRRNRRRDSAMTRSFVLSSFRRGNSYTAKGCTSSKAIHPLRSSSCRSSMLNHSSREKQGMSWPIRFKRRVLQLWGRGYDKNDSIVRDSTTLPPFIMGDSCMSALTQGELEEIELKMKLNNGNHMHNRELDETS